MTVENHKASTKQEVWIPAKYVKPQTIKGVHKWIVVVESQKILMPFEALKYDLPTKGYRGMLPSNILFPALKSLPPKINSKLLITIFPKKKRPKGDLHV